MDSNVYKKMGTLYGFKCFTWNNDQFIWFMFLHDLVINSIYKYV